MSIVDYDTRNEAFKLSQIAPSNKGMMSVDEAESFLIGSKWRALAKQVIASPENSQAIEEETRGILAMWGLIYKSANKDRSKSEPSNENPEFIGFREEADAHFTVAQRLIEQDDDLSWMRGKSITSGGYESLPKHRDMLVRLELLKQLVGDGALTHRQVNFILAEV